MVQTPSTADPEITACPCPTLPRAIRQRQPGSSSSAREAGSATPALGAESKQQKTCLLGDEHSTRVPVHVLPCSEVYNSSHSAAGRLSQGVSYLRSPRGWDVTW